MSYFSEWPISGYTFNSTIFKQPCTLRFSHDKIHVFSLLSCDITFPLSNTTRIDSYSLNSQDLRLISESIGGHGSKYISKSILELHSVPKEAFGKIQESLAKGKNEETNGPKLFKIKVKSPRGLMISSQMFRDPRKSNKIVIALRPSEKSALFEEFPETLGNLTRLLGKEAEENQLWRDFWSKKLMKALFGTSKLNGKQTVHPMVSNKYAEMNLNINDLSELLVVDYEEISKENKQFITGQNDSKKEKIMLREEARKEGETNDGLKEEKLRIAVDLGTDYSATKAETSKWGKHEDVLCKLNMISIQSFEKDQKAEEKILNKGTDGLDQQEYDDKYLEVNPVAEQRKEMEVENQKVVAEKSKKATAMEKKNWTQFLKHLNEAKWQEICQMILKQKSKSELLDADAKTIEENQTALKNMNIMQLDL